MVSKIGFWTPISYMSGPQPFSTRLVSLVDSYFDCWIGNLILGGIVYAVPEHMNLGKRKVVGFWTLPETRSSLGVALKMASHLTVIIPVLRSWELFSKRCC